MTKINMSYGSDDATTSNYVTTGANMVNLESLLQFMPKRVVKEPSPTLDQQTAAALNRLNVALQAEITWAQMQIKNEFKEGIRHIECVFFLPQSKLS